jgi:putative transport protein
MLDIARDILGSQPILDAFLAIGIGYLVGQINIGGFSLGVGAVLFVGLRRSRRRRKSPARSGSLA